MYKQSINSNQIQQCGWPKCIKEAQQYDDLCNWHRNEYNVKKLKQSTLNYGQQQYNIVVNNNHHYHHQQKQQNWDNQSNQSNLNYNYQRREKPIPSQSPRRYNDEYINYDNDENLWTNKEPDIWVIIELFLDPWYTQYVQQRLDNVSQSNIITDLSQIRPNMKCCSKCSHPSITQGLRFGHIVKRCLLPAYSIQNQFALLSGLHFYWKGYGGPDKLITFFHTMGENLTFYSCYLVDKAWYLAKKIPPNGRKKSMLYIFIFYLRIFAYYHIYT